MEIVNPAPGTPYGWLTRGVCHALEVGWPEMETAAAIPPLAAPTITPTQPSRSGAGLGRP
jgi:hypothetical protein